MPVIAGRVRHASMRASGRACMPIPFRSWFGVRDSNGLEHRAPASRLTVIRGEMTHAEGTSLQGSNESVGKSFGFENDRHYSLVTSGLVRLSCSPDHHLTGTNLEPLVILP